jgi:hypothetical protein
MAEQPIGITFSEEVQTQMFGAGKADFPIDFDDAWVWLDYSRKDSALRHMQGTLKIQLDYIEAATDRFHNNVESGEIKGSSPNKYFLTTEGFKVFCMAAGTNRGDEVRRYFVQVEQAYKQHVTEQAVNDVFPQPNSETLVVGSVGTRTPGLLTPANKWLEELGKLRVRTASRYNGNPELCHQLLKELDAQAAAGYEASVPFFVPPQTRKTNKAAPPAPTPNAASAPPTTTSAALVQATNGLSGAVFIKHMPVYQAPIGGRRTKIRLGGKNKAGVLELHPVMTDGLQVELAELVATIEPGTLISNYKLADALCDTSITAAIGERRLNSLIGRMMLRVGWRRYGSYKTIEQGTGIVYRTAGWGADA